MVKGVNKRIVEVQETGNEYFEKAILFLRPSRTDLEESRLEGEAGRYLRQLGYTPPAVKSWAGRAALAALKFGGAAALGAAAMSLIKF